MRFTVNTLRVRLCYKNEHATGRPRPPRFFASWNNEKNLAEARNAGRNYPRQPAQTRSAAAPPSRFGYLCSFYGLPDYWVPTGHSNLLMAFHYVC